MKTVKSILAIALLSGSFAWANETKQVIKQQTETHEILLHSVTFMDDDTVSIQFFDPTTVPRELELSYCKGAKKLFNVKKYKMYENEKIKLIRQYYINEKGNQKVKIIYPNSCQFLKGLNANNE